MTDFPRNRLHGRWLRERFPFIDELILIEKNIGNLMPKDETIWQLPLYVEIEVTFMAPDVLNQLTHSERGYKKEEGIPDERMWTDEPTLPDRIGPVPTYAIKNGKVVRLGLEFQITDPGYIDDGYKAHVRFRQPPQTIREALIATNVQEPDFLVLRQRDIQAVRFEVIPYEPVEYYMAQYTSFGEAYNMLHDPVKQAFVIIKSNEEQIARQMLMRYEPRFTKEGMVYSVDSQTTLTPMTKSDLIRFIKNHLDDLAIVHVIDPKKE